MPEIKLSLKQAHIFLKQHIHESNIIRHSEATKQKAVQIAHLIAPKESVNIQLIELGALLHDIGRTRTHDITHGYVGGQLLHQNGYPSSVVKIVERHVLGGFTPQEAPLVGLPKRDFVPHSWEEIIVCVADKLGSYEWNGINQPQKWLSKMDARFAQLKKRYDISAPYRASMQRARNFVRILVNLASHD
ncbi:MAG: HDIG domain-containing protein [Candidatus Hermodarchaeota archaeon]|nr:HDIG domain-containing protein [Candidatus Hermodarchaeota archaeon]